MNTCDLCDQHLAYLLVCPRPSDPSEIVSTMGFCEEHAGLEEISTLDALKSFWTDQGYRITTAEILREYIESPEAAAHGHLFLTI